MGDTTSTSPFIVPDDVAATVNTIMARNHAKYAGWSMEATGGDSGTADTGDGAGDTGNGGTGDSSSGDDQQSGDGGKGGKESVLADLARERDKRQEAETALQQAQQSQQSQLDAIAKALGLKDEDKPDPEKLTQQVSQEQAKARDAQVQLAVYRQAAKAGGNPDALLDSASFLASLADVDPSKADEVEKAIKDAVQSNPTLAAKKVTPGTRDAANQGGSGDGKPDMNDLLRAAAGR